MNCNFKFGGGLVVLFKRHLHSFLKYLPLLFLLTAKDFKLKYRRSVLGVLWSMLNPLLLMVVFSAVFTLLLKVPPDGMPFSVYYITGSTLFSFFADATSGAMVSVVNNSLLLQKIYIPKYIFPIEKCLFALVNAVFSTFAVFFVLLFYVIAGEVQLHLTVFLIFIPLVFVFLFSVGVSLILAVLTVFFRDIIHIWGVLTTILFHLTPIIYPIKLLDNYGIGRIVKLNPLYYFVDDFRQLLILGQLPPLSHFLVGLGVCGAILVLGFATFKRLQDKFVLHI